ncbi:MULTISPECIES: phosphopantetheine-binding protein [unclassified Streptomyces]|uniref:phosphopantetheine-binding protein n=1 Tax=unclassified Streptomyces TaxID=2593676 RepID=UPI000DAC6C2E|nr:MULTISPECIES: phosphopantetheine-binding protein [unclassified Streptomyces]PZT72589.1 phosphopantetheine-binding protein [Streptomyces sp. AC1-42T]PZT81093.1 phosphopantetheine-binding protein [Streptomyces sp. AC1-42W]
MKTTADSADRTPTEVSAALRQAVETLIGTEHGTIEPDANLIHVGLGSLEMMRLVNQWRRNGLPVSFRELAAEPTLEAWQRHLNAVALGSGKATA